MGEKPNSAQRGAENQLSAIPQNTTGAKDNSTSLKLELHSERARVEVPPRAEPGVHQGSILDCTWTAAQLCVPLLTQPRGHTTSPLFLLCQAELKLRPTSLHKRHQQQSPAQELPQRTVWGQRCHYCSPAKPSLVWHPKKKASEVALTQETPSRCCSPADSARDEAGGIWLSTKPLASTWRWQWAEARGESGLQQQMASEVDLR